MRLVFLYFCLTIHSCVFNLIVRSCVPLKLSAVPEWKRVMNATPSPGADGVTMGQAPAWASAWREGMMALLTTAMQMPWLPSVQATCGSLLSAQVGKFQVLRDISNEVLVKTNRKELSVTKI